MTVCPVAFGEGGGTSCGAGLAVVVEHAAADVVTVRVEGELDVWTTPMLETVLDDLLDRRPLRLLVLELSGLRFAAACGVRLLVRLRDRLEPHARMRLRLVGLKPPVARVLALTGVSSTFTICETVESAVTEGLHLVMDAPCA